MDMEKKYWATLEHFAEDPTFLESAGKEFISSPLVEDSKGLDRRDFMKLMAASTALASSACFQKPMHKILPYVNQPQEITFGQANYYASTCTECSAGCGTLVKTREGRPIKLEGNPDHPMNKGGLCARGQAGILSLYDPDRLRFPLKSAKRGEAGAKSAWSNIDGEVSTKLKNAKHVRILSETIHSPSTLKLTKEFLSGFADGQHIVYDSIGASAIIDAQEISFGQRTLPRFRFDKADVIVSIDADFLGTWISPVEFAKQYSTTRKLNKKKKTLSQLFSFESAMTITGTNADVRTPIRPTDSLYIALGIASELSAHGLPASGEMADVLKNFRTDSLNAMGINGKAVKSAAEALMKNEGRSLVVAADNVDTQVAVNLINHMLKNDGVTIDHSASSLQFQGNSKALTHLIKEMNAGLVDALIIYKANPVYSLPENSGFKTGLAKVATVMYVGTDLNETALQSDYVLADHHGLESWGDAEPQKGLYSLQQPTIRPLFDTRAFQDSLIAVAKISGNGKLKAVEDWHSYVQKNWQDTIYKTNKMKASFISFWESSLRDGVSDSRKSATESKTSSPRTYKGNLKPVKPSVTTGMQAVFYPQIANYDGSMANNAWLQELPDPVTRMCWDNYASVSPATAQKLGLKDGDIVTIKAGENTLEIPGHVQPGLHDQTIAIALGYGRESAGKIGTGVGKNLFKFSTVSDKGVEFVTSSMSIAKTGEKYVLATPQQHQTLEGRPIVKEASLVEWIKSPNAGNEEKEKLTTLWPEHKYEGYRWAMAIDMNSCTGCNACVIGCQSENNVPVVGKDGVSRGRIMHWIRIDRYYTGTPDNPQVVHQPMLCQHCENAPCETVCPVIATMHDSEGINAQIYNRCVGTRYCANNCPYKVRRFNWFEYNFGGQNRYPTTMAQNPEVTVRSRGVMEKCSFCIQRIQDSRNNAKNLGRGIQDGEVKTACQQSCPSDAIVFGNINDPNSEVSQMARDPRAYHVLEELNTKPSVTYLTKIRNAEII